MRKTSARCSRGAACCWHRCLARRRWPRPSPAKSRGTVRDSSGGVLPGVTVTVTNTQTGLTRTDVDRRTGSYVVTNLPIGPYAVAAELQGFRKAEKTGFELIADGRVTADFTMSIGALTETVTVDASAATR